MNFANQIISLKHYQFSNKKNEKKNHKYIYVKLMGMRMKKKDQKSININNYIEVEMKRRDQKYISASKLLGVKIKKGKTRLIIIIIDIFPPFFIKKY